MKKDARGRTYPTTREEWDLYEALVREGWHPRLWRQADPIFHHTCLVCGHIYPKGAGTRIHSDDNPHTRTVCSPPCLPEYKAHVRTMRKLLRRLVRIYHHQRVKEWLDERGWRTQQPQVDLRVRRVRQITTTYATHRKWRRDGHTLVCKHPNVKGWLRVYTGRALGTWALKDVHVLIPAVPLDQPLPEPMFNCVATAVPGHVRARALLRSTDGRCQCVTCQAVPRIVDLHTYNRLRAEVDQMNSQPPPRWRMIEGSKELANAAQEESAKWRARYAAQRAARSGGAIPDIPHHGGDDHGEGGSGTEGGG